jgi:FAD/FMN-containing dehydrogenase
MSARATTPDFPQTFSGRLVTPTDPDYDETRAVHNGLVDKRPALIVRCRGAADVIDAVNVARQAELPVAVRGGGHNVAGRATIEGGVLIDLSLMKGVHVDPRTQTAHAQGGATWGEFNRETQVHALATTGGVVSSTGIGGLTLGGGLGWLLGEHGLAIDNLQSAQIVTAAGELLTASADENTDLFWAIRGGGGNFGIATSFEYGLHPVGPTLHGGLVLHPFAAAGDVLRVYRDLTSKAPDDLTVFCGFLHAPDGSGTKLAGMVACYSGPAERAEAALAPLKSFGSPVMDTLGPIPYCQLNTLFDASIPRGVRNYWKSSFLSALSDEAIATIIDVYASCPSPMSQLIIEHFHGAACRVAPDATAFPHRNAGYNFLLLSQWTSPADDQPNMAWTRERYASMQPFVGTGRYMNYLDHDDMTDAAAAAYGANYRRLQAIKAKYDPANFFRQNLNVKPLAEQAPTAPSQAAGAALGEGLS